MQISHLTSHPKMERLGIPTSLTRHSARLLTKNVQVKIHHRLQGDKTPRTPANNKIIKLMALHPRALAGHHK